MSAAVADAQVILNVVVGRQRRIDAELISSQK